MKPAALFTVSAALLTILAPHRLLAAPEDKTPVTVETARTYSYTVTNWATDKDNRVLPASVDHVLAAVPDKACDERKSLRPDNKLHQLLYVDGKKAGVYDFLVNKYEAIPLNDQAVSPNDVVGIDPHYHLPPGKAKRVLLDGKPALLYTQSEKRDNKTTTVTRTYYDAHTHEELLITGNISGGKHHGELAFKMVYSDWKINPPLPKSRSAFAPPPGSQLVDDLTEKEDTADFLKPGTPAPDFTTYDGNGKAVKLSDYAGKVVLIDFWATWCGGCQEMLPDTNKIARKYAGQVVTLGISVWDKPTNFQKWLPLHKNLNSIVFVSDPTTYPKAGTANKYGIVAIPSQYVIGKDGEVAAAFCVAPPNKLTAALEKAIHAKHNVR